MPSWRQWEKVVVERDWAKKDVGPHAEWTTVGIEAESTGLARWYNNSVKRARITQLKSIALQHYHKKTSKRTTTINLAKRTHRFTRAAELKTQQWESRSRKILRKTNNRAKVIDAGGEEDRSTEI